MESSHSSLFVDDDLSGESGSTLEQCSPISWPEKDQIDEIFVRKMITRLHAATFHPPAYLSIFALSRQTLGKILSLAREKFHRERNIVDVVVPHNGQVHIFGDTHGDFHSLLAGLSKAGLPSDNNILVFAGDCVDRGPWGVEVTVILYLLKIWQPNNVVIVRGNHETTGCICRYGFSDEVKHKYDATTLSVYTRLFRELPLAAIIRTVPHTEAVAAVPAKRKKRREMSRIFVNAPHPGEEWRKSPLPGEKRVLVVHGGLYRSWKGRKVMELGDLLDLQQTNRREDDPNGCLVEDVIWSDPHHQPGTSFNFMRGAGILYGTGTVENFFKRNYLHGLLRAHEGPDMREKRGDMNDIQKGFSIDIEVASGFVATVFSAANYRKLYAKFLSLQAQF